MILNSTIGPTSWVVAEGFKIYEGGLWKKTEPDNPLSELIEVSKLDYLGLENDIDIYVCNHVPKELVDWMLIDMGDDTHVYMGTLHTDREQKAILWPY